MEDDNEMTTVESWYKAESKEETDIDRDWNLPFKGGHQTIKTGTIIESLKDIVDGN